MGDELYTIPLPWVVFAVIARTATHGVVWASIAGVVTAATLLATRRPMHASRNNLMTGAVAWFSALAVLGIMFDSHTSWLARNGRGFASLGFVLIALGSLVATPVAVSYTRMRIKPSHWKSPRFEHLNVQLTLLWAATFTGIGIAQFVAAEWVGNGRATGGPFTVFNWVVPIALGVIAAHWSRQWWDDFVEGESEGSSWDLALAWDERQELPPGL
jgi:hypothetical protein